MPYTPHLDMPAGQRREFDAAEKLDRTLAASLEEGGFLVLSAEPPLMLRAIDELQARFSTEILNLDELFLNAIRRVADEKHIDWNRVLSADAAPENHPERRNLERLVAAITPAIEHDLATRSQPLLLTFPGLLATQHRCPGECQSRAGVRVWRRRESVRGGHRAIPIADCRLAHL
jgi:hypothetical protein